MTHSYGKVAGVALESMQFSPIFFLNSSNVRG